VPDPKIRIYDVGMKRADVDTFPCCVHLARCARGGGGGAWACGLGGRRMMLVVRMCAGAPAVLVMVRWRCCCMVS
jgi:hypothetical protein